MKGIGETMEVCQLGKGDQGGDDRRSREKKGDTQLHTHTLMHTTATHPHRTHSYRLNKHV